MTATAIPAGGGRWTRGRPGDDDLLLVRKGVGGGLSVLSPSTGKGETQAFIWSCGPELLGPGQRSGLRFVLGRAGAEGRERWGPRTMEGPPGSPGPCGLKTQSELSSKPQSLFTLSPLSFVFLRVILLGSRRTTGLPVGLSLTCHAFPRNSTNVTVFHFQLLYAWTPLSLFL